VDSVFTGSPGYEFDHRVLHSNGDVVWLHSRGDAVRDEQGAPVRLYGTVVDRTAAELAEQRDRQHARDLVQLASHDALTGLANRGLLRERLGHALARRGPGVSLLVLNVDDFKAVNNVAGHAGGDQIPRCPRVPEVGAFKPLTGFRRTSTGARKHAGLQPQLQPSRRRRPVFRRVSG
jgi:hypothetical protein